MSDDQRAGTAPIPAEEPEEAPSPAAGTNDAENGDSETDDNLVTKLRKENAGHRAKLRDAEARAETAEARAQAVLDHVLAVECAPYRIAPRALQLAEKDPSNWFGPDGFDRKALRDDISEVASMFGVRKPGHSPYTGTGGERPTSRTWGDALKRD